MFCCLGLCIALIGPPGEQPTEQQTCSRKSCVCEDWRHDGKTGIRRLYCVRSLFFPRVTDETILGLPPIPFSVGLDLESTGITDAGMKQIGGLENLTSLDLTGTAVSDVGLKELARARKLLRLNLRATRVTDAGLKEVVKLTNLASLKLSSTAVTDAGLQELTKLKNLRVLNLTNTKVTNEGIEKLKKALPIAHIFQERAA
jgi:hypothetical protein